MINSFCLLIHLSVIFLPDSQSPYYVATFSISYTWCFYFALSHWLTYCGSVMLHDNIDVGTTLADGTKPLPDSSLKVFCDIQLRAILEVLISLFRNIACNFEINTKSPRHWCANLGASQKEWFGTNQCYSENLYSTAPKLWTLFILSRFCWCWVHVILPISCRVTSLALGLLHDCPISSVVSL